MEQFGFDVDAIDDESPGLDHSLVAVTLWPPPLGVVSDPYRQFLNLVRGCFDPPDLLPKGRLRAGAREQGGTISGDIRTRWRRTTNTSGRRKTRTFSSRSKIYRSPP